jgi:hypothetical protein
VHGRVDVVLVLRQAAVGGALNLDHRIRSVLAQLEIRLHYGSITAYNSSGSGGKAEGGDCPPGESYPPHDRYRLEYIACEDDHCRIRVCEAAESLLKTLTSVKTVEVVPETREDRRQRILSKPGWPAQDVARWMQGGVREVHAARVEAGVDPERGLELPQMADSTERVLALAARWCSVRQIEAQTGVPKSTVQRILRRAA